MGRRPTTLPLGTDARGQRFALPLDAATRRQAIVATSGAGKSNAAVVMAESMYAAGIPFVAIDPKGDWYGVRSNAEGDGPGLDVPVLGGTHGDIPLDPTSGKIVARMISERRMTCVLDVSEFDTRQDQFRFLADLAETLLRVNKGRGPLHLFLEEADEYLPQRLDVKGNLPACVGNWGRLVRRGRNHGLGSTLITQRSAVVSKDVLYLAEALYAMRIASEPDRKTIAGWVTSKSTGAEIVDQLPALDDGEAFVISPGWLKRTERIQFGRRRTFDSGATPVFGDDVAAATLAPVDLDVLKGELAATIERANADDPDRLRAEIADLRRELSTRKTVEVPVEKVVPVYPSKADVDATKTALVEALAVLDDALPRFADVRRRLVEALDAAKRAVARQSLANAPTSGDGGLVRKVKVDQGDPVTVLPAGSVREVPSALAGHRHFESANDLGEGAPAKIVALLAQHPNGLSKGRIYPLAGYSKRATTVRNALSRLRGLGLVTVDGEIVQLTETGRAATAHVEALPTGPALLDYWRSRLGAGAARRIFDLLVERSPRPVMRGAVYEMLDYSPDATTVRNALSRLRGYDLLEASTDSLRLNPTLMGDHS